MIKEILLWYLAAVNIAAWAAFGIDKRKARKGRWRIPERTLLLLAFIGGSLGALAAMCMFRHKTRKARFFISIPVMFVAHCIGVTALLLNISNIS